MIFAHRPRAMIVAGASFICMSIATAQVALVQNAKAAAKPAAAKAKPAKPVKTRLQRLFVSGSAGGIAEMQVPADWEMAGRSTPIVARFKAPDAADKLVLTAFPLARERIALTTDDKLQEMLRTSGAPMLKFSIETALELQALGAGASGYYFAVSDKALAGKHGKAEQFPFVHSGVVRFGDWVGVFNIYSDEKENAFVKQALAAMAGLRWAGPAAQERAVAKGLGAIRFAATPPALQAKDQVQCVSPQAYLVFTKFNERYASLLGTKVVKTDFQSFDAGGGDLGSVLMMEFDAPLKPDAKSFFGGLIWGESFPTRAHPEEFFIAGKQMVIWCTQIESRIKRLSQARLEAALFPVK
ncbi:MAG: hypothetical protein JWN73_839 [Betaproteobacteria bacterium]|nr:hypothetical protein [Betaproteobacteria bacterium]